MRHNWYMIAANALLLLMVALLIFGIASCAPYPAVKYYDMDAAIAAATTPEEKEYYEKKRDKFEIDAEKAENWFWNRALCIKGAQNQWGDDMVWICHGVPPKFERMNLDDLDIKVKAYRQWRHSCGCADKDQVMNSLGWGQR